VDTVATTFMTFQSRAALEGVGVQHMFQGNVELLVTAFRHREFGVIVGCGMGVGMTEIIDDVAFARADRCGWRI
jgi:acyl-CoA synthetase (NDP forming)